MPKIRTKDVRAYCRQKWGGQWHNVPKSEKKRRKRLARKCLTGICDAPAQPLKVSEHARELIACKSLSCETMVECCMCNHSMKNTHLYIMNDSKRPSYITYTVGCSHVAWDSNPWCSYCWTLLVKDGTVHTACSRCARVTWGRPESAPEGCQYVDMDMLKKMNATEA